MTKTKTVGHNEVTRKIWQIDEQWTGYELVQAIGEDGRTYPTVDGERHEHFPTEQEAQTWVNQ